MTSNPFYAFGIGMAAVSLLLFVFAKQKHGAIACVLVAALSGWVGTFHDA